MTDKYRQQNSHIIQEIIQQDLAWAKAHLDLDLNMIADIASEDYRQRQSNGTFIDKAKLLASFRSGMRHWEIAESFDHHVQLAGNLAILIGRWYGKGVNTGISFDYYARFLSLYELENGMWKMILDVSIPDDVSSWQ